MVTKPTQPHTRARVVSVTREVFADLNEKIGPEARFTNVQEWPLPHFWLYSPDGSVVIFTCAKIARLESVQLAGEF